MSSVSRATAAQRGCASVLRRARHDSSIVPALAEGPTAPARVGRMTPNPSTAASGTPNRYCLIEDHLLSVGTRLGLGDAEGNVRAGGGDDPPAGDHLADRCASHAAGS